MTNQTLKTYNDINWAQLRANALEAKGWKDKGPKEWDKKAESFAGRNKNATYIDLVLAQLPLDPSMSVLDIGSGPGTLALPIAKMVKSVSAVDFSRGMLDALKQFAQEQNIDNVTCVQCAWEDDWRDKGLLPHDIAIASRSMGVKDLEPALKKINNFAKQYVFLSDRIGATPFDQGAFKALGRPFTLGPDYIYTLNTLYTMGIHPNVTVLELEPEVTYPSMDEAISSFSWMFHGITADELITLKHYIQSKIISSEPDAITIRKDSPPRWALIWWKK